MSVSLLDASIITRVDANCKVLCDLLRWMCDAAELFAMCQSFEIVLSLAV